MNNLQFDATLHHVTNEQFHRAAWTIAINTEDPDERAELLQMVGLAQVCPDGQLRPTAGEQEEMPWR